MKIVSKLLCSIWLGALAIPARPRHKRNIVEALLEKIVIENGGAKTCQAGRKRVSPGYCRTRKRKRVTKTKTCQSRLL